MALFELARARNATLDRTIDAWFEAFDPVIDHHHFPSIQDYREPWPGRSGGHVGPEHVRNSLQLARPRYNQIVQWLQPAGGRRLLDIGPAFGFLDIILIERLGYDLTAVEHPRNFAAYAGLLRARGIEPVEWEVGTARAPFPAGSFDVVVFAEVLEHLKMAPRRMLRHVTAPLRDGGLLVLTTPNIARRQNIAALERGENILEPFREDLPADRDPTDFVPHIREYTVGEIQELLDAVGLEVLDLAFANLPGDDLDAQPLLNHYQCWLARKRARAPD